MWPKHGKLWGHLVSDESLEELHEAARAVSIPPRAFDKDHYDILPDSHPALIDLGATMTTGRDLVRRLRASGLRVTEAERRALEEPSS